MKKYNVEVVHLIEEYLKKDDWNFHFNEERGVFEFGIRINSRIRSIRYLLKVNESNYSVYGFSPITADPTDKKLMMTMTEFLCRANYGLRNGAFEMDMEDGEIRYHTFVDFEGILPSDQVIKRSIYTVSHMFEEYGQGIVDVIFAGKSAKAACDACEEEANSRMEAAERAMDILRSGGSRGEIAPLLARMLGYSADEDSDGTETSDEEEDTLPMDLFDEQDEAE